MKLWACRSVGSQRFSDEVGDAGEIDDFVEARQRVLAAQAKQGGVQVDILSAGEIGVKSGTEFEQRRHPPVDGDRAGIGLGEAGHHAEQGTLARSVRPDNGHAFGMADAERDVFERVEGLVRNSSEPAAEVAAQQQPAGRPGEGLRNAVENDRVPVHR